MFEYVKGLLVELTPTSAIVETNGLAFNINISLFSYTSLKQGQECKLYLHQIIREDAHILYGFSEKFERELFRNLISVNGVGPNTARLILSSVNPNLIIKAIAEEDVNIFKNVKGIGIKTAQRIVIELKGKNLIPESEFISGEIFTVSNNTLYKDSLNALMMLGFSKPAIEKVLNKIFKENNDINLEEVIKKALVYL
ncbi:MAG: Holliday junction branch migration protein RuvA [Bacteroidales bacterium]